MPRTKRQNNGMCVFAAVIWPTSLCLTVVGNLLRTQFIIESMTSSENTMTRFLSPSESFKGGRSTNELSQIRRLRPARYMYGMKFDL